MEFALVGVYKQSILLQSFQHFSNVLPMFFERPVGVHKYIV